MLAVTVVLQPPPSTPARVTIGTVARVVDAAASGALPAAGQPQGGGGCVGTGGSGFGAGLEPRVDVVRDALPAGGGVSRRTWPG